MRHAGMDCRNPEHRDVKLCSRHWRLDAGNPCRHDEADIACEILSMLVTFQSKVSADVTMFGDVAARMLKLMGHSGTVPGALLAEDVPAALVRLKQAVEVDRGSLAASESGAEEGESGERAVSLAHRALPLIELLTAAEAAGCYVTWDKY